MSQVNEMVARQCAALARELEAPLAALAGAVGLLWREWERVDRILAEGFSLVPRCQLLYAVDVAGRQCSANITPRGLDEAARGQELAERPYLSEAVPTRGFLLSDVYLSRVSGRPCITAVQTIPAGGRVVGFLAADFDLLDLPPPPPEAPAPPTWRQIKGDPAIRGTVFMQSRVRSAMDERLDDVFAIVGELIRERGVFHVKLHFSSSRVTVWLMDNPYSYDILVLDELVNPAVCLAYRRQPYPAIATVPAESIAPALARFKVLREADETIYLRSASLNIVNGMVGLTFSCDGSHYLPLKEFLARGEELWFGAA